MGCHERETEKENLPGYSSKRRFMSVLFPVPLGPEMTTGRNFWTAGYPLELVSARQRDCGDGPALEDMLYWERCVRIKGLKQRDRARRGARQCINSTRLGEVWDEG